MPRTANEPSASSQSTSAQTADPRSQQRSLGRRKKGEKKLGDEKCANRFLLLLRILSLGFCRFLCSEGDPKSRRSHPTGAARGESRNLGQLLKSGEFQIPRRRSHFCPKRAFKNSLGPGRSPLCPPRILRSWKHAEQIPDQEKSRLTDPKRAAQNSIAVKYRAEF